MSRDFWPSVFSWLQPILAQQFGFRRDVRSKRLINLTPRRISHRRVKILVLVYQTFFFKSFLSCNMCSPLNRQRFWFWLRCVQFDSPVWCTPRSQAPQYVHTTESNASNILFFRIRYVFQRRFTKNVWSQKGSVKQFLSYSIIFTLISSGIREKLHL